MNRNHLKLLGLRSWMCLLMLCAVSAQKSCFTPYNTYGRCVPAVQCLIVQKLWEKFGSNVPQHFQEDLIKAQCDHGKTPVHICCENNQIIHKLPDSTSTTAQDPKNYEASLNANGVRILKAQRCGRDFGDKIANGVPAKLSEYPWMALLQYNDKSQPFKCGGSLITNRYVLTAAHCVVEIDFEVRSVRLGEHDINSEIDCAPGIRKRKCAPPVEDVGIEKIIPHPEYSRAHKINDIALIKLDRSVPFTKHIAPICLPITEAATNFESDQRFFIAGWGLTEKGFTSSVLQKATVKFMSREMCQRIHSRTRITYNHICAGGDSNTDTCQGDSGGPLFFLAPVNNTRRHVQFGIVSFGTLACGGDRTYPGIYSNVVDLMPWLTNHLTES